MRSRGVALWGAAFAVAGLTLVASAQPQAKDETPPRHLWIEMPPPPATDWTRHFRIGALVGINIKADFKMNGQFDVSGSNPGAPGVGGVEHFYDDGYVRVDDTGNALGLTSYWGYRNGSQYDASAQTLTFHSAKSFTSSGSSRVDDSPYLGFDLAYGGNLWQSGRTRIGWEFGFGLLPIGIKDRQPMTTDIIRTVHSFDTGGIRLPTAPYNGGPSGIGPTIHDVATESSDSTSGTITGSRNLDMTLFVFRLGPLLHWELHPRWAVSLSAGPAVGLLSGELGFDEIVVSADGSSGRNTGKIGSSDVVFGGYVGATLMYHAVEHGDVFIGVQYLPLTSSTVSGSGREARLNMSGGMFFSAGFNWPF